MGHMKGIREKSQRETSAKITVDCYSGYKINQRPWAFSLGRKKIKVTDILDQWYGPDHTYFKVLAENKNTYILRYSEAHDLWDVVFFKEGGYHGETSLGTHGEASA
jgi:hypothetical protein